MEMYRLRAVRGSREVPVPTETRHIFYIRILKCVEVTQHMDGCGGGGGGNDVLLLISKQWAYHTPSEKAV